MLKHFLVLLAVCLSLNIYGQNNDVHYIKFLHVGEKILPVHTMNISFVDVKIPADPVEIINDTLRVIQVVTDERSYNILVGYLKTTNFKLSKNPGKLEFGTFKIIRDGQYFYLPDFSSTDYFKKMAKYLKKKNADPQLISSIIDNYPWIYNP